LSVNTFTAQSVLKLLLSYKLFEIKLLAVDGLMPIPVAARSKIWAYVPSLDDIVLSKPAGNMDVCLL
jgi:hypothetical protein